MSEKSIQTALISVYHKEGLDEIIEKLVEKNVKIYSTGGTLDYIKKLGANPVAVEDLTSYPSIFGGRVKTLHPKVFGGILYRREEQSHRDEAVEYEIPPLDLVIVDLYPFEETLASGANEQDIIEKIDIGGISLIRAAAKNFKDVLVVPSQEQYADLAELLSDKVSSTLEQRKAFAAKAFSISSHYDYLIGGYLSEDFQAELPHFHHTQSLRYGENPHQKAKFIGQLDAVFDQLHGKQLSYNNLLDVDAAVCLMHDLPKNKPAVAILKHNNACGVALRDTLITAWNDALAGDPVSAFGGIIITNQAIDAETAKAIDEIFYEVVIAPDFDDDALTVLSSKKNRIVLKLKNEALSKAQIRTVVGGVLVQERDNSVETKDDFVLKTNLAPSQQETDDLVFANILVKHTKSNTIVLAKNGQLLASGTGQTSRVDALKQAIVKAKAFNFDLTGAVMASDAFFPFPDCVEIANAEGIKAVVQPGGSIKDKDSIEFCNNNGMSMVFTGVRHFKH